jgi:dTDP-4-dehydrorhamnose reductase
MRWTILGAGGQLGRSLAHALAGAERHQLVAAPRHDELDVADGDAVRAFLADRDVGPGDVVANAAAFTQVDRCESEPALAARVNAEAPAALARLCAERGVRLVHVSTDYVFDGEARRPYTEDDPTGPRSVYGRTKLAGEHGVLAALPAALVVRSCWLFGPGRNFVRTMIEQAQARRTAPDRTGLRVVDDQFGSPTYTADLAEALVRLVEGGASGLYHAANRGVATWWDLARETLDRAGFRDLVIERVRTSEFPRPAPRPAYSALDCSKAARGGARLRGWRDALAAYLESEDSPLPRSGGIA